MPTMRYSLPIILGLAVNLVAISTEGIAQTSRKAIEGLCTLLAIPFDPERRALLQTLDAASLEALHDRILAERRWP